MQLDKLSLEDLDILLADQDNRIIQINRNKS
jgi:hypothetical protein